MIVLHQDPADEDGRRGYIENLTPGLARQSSALFCLTVNNNHNNNNHHNNNQESFFFTDHSRPTRHTRGSQRLSSLTVSFSGTRKAFSTPPKGNLEEWSRLRACVCKGRLWRLREALPTSL
ncbi:hypothetical protein VTH06DRAFT_6639 [Thermothelomyces fergusii]